MINNFDDDLEEFYLMNKRKKEKLVEPEDDDHESFILKWLCQAITFTFVCMLFYCCC